MEISDEEVKRFEQRAKETIFEKISELSAKQTKIINSSDTIQRQADVVREDMPNIGITLNNKIVEISHEFENAGISMFSNKDEEYGIVTSSELGDSILEDLLDKLEKGIIKLDDYGKSCSKIAKRKSRRDQFLQVVGPLKRFFLQIRAVLMNERSLEYNALTEKEEEELATKFKEFKEANDEIWNYDLRENIAPSVIKHLKSRGYNIQALTDLLSKDIGPDLQKLGFEDLMPQIEKAIGVEEKEMPGKLSPEQKREFQEKTAEVLKGLQNKESSETSKTAEKPRTR